LRIAIVDYGMGNLCSVQKALERIGAFPVVTDSAEDLKGAEKIVIPGVGAFGDAMKEMEKRNLAAAVKEEAARGKKLLGICLGLQIFFEKSEESPGVRGLGLFPGEVKRFVTELKVPHMGWNQIRIRRPAPIFQGIGDGAFFYFVHSYYAAPENPDDIATTTDYAVEFASSVWRGNLYGMQFHPEKSQASGLKLLENFVKLGD